MDFELSDDLQRFRAGIRGAHSLIAVNTDPSAPIFTVADYAAAADLFDLARELPRYL
jgi:electron transfer flavoprotein alpha subunit